MKSKDSNRSNFFTLKDYEKQISLQIVFDAFGLGGLEVDGGGRNVSSSDREKVTADRARVVHRLGRAQTRDVVYALETKAVTRKTLEDHAASVREFFDWSVWLSNSIVKAFEVDRHTEFICWQIAFFLFPIFSKLSML